MERNESFERMMAELRARLEDQLDPRFDCSIEFRLKCGGLAGNVNVTKVLPPPKKTS